VPGVAWRAVCRVDKKLRISGFDTVYDWIGISKSGALNEADKIASGLRRTGRRLLDRGRTTLG